MHRAEKDSSDRPEGDSANVDERVVDNHVIVGNARALIFFSNLTESVEEQTVTELHDIRLVHAGHFLKSKGYVLQLALDNERPRATHLTVVLERKIESKPSNALSLCSCRDLQAFDDTRIALVL